MQADDQTVDADRKSLIIRASREIDEKLGINDIMLIRSYANPPPGVKDVLIAALLLLRGLKEGQDPWKEAKQIISDRKLKTDIANINYKNIPVETRNQAMAYLSKHDPDQLKMIDMTALLFYNWVKAVASP